MEDADGDGRCIRIEIENRNQQRVCCFAEDGQGEEKKRPLEIRQ
jgi:hypothetical protein